MLVSILHIDTFILSNFVKKPKTNNKERVKSETRTLNIVATRHHFNLLN